MKKMNADKERNAVEASPQADKKEYQAPKCAQHKPLDHVRTWQTKSLPS
jgi:hypothetical protein